MELLHLHRTCHSQVSVLSTPQTMRIDRGSERHLYIIVVHNLYISLYSWHLFHSMNKQTLMKVALSVLFITNINTSKTLKKIVRNNLTLKKIQINKHIKHIASGNMFSVRVEEQGYLSLQLAVERAGWSWEAISCITIWIRHLGMVWGIWGGRWLKGLHTLQKCSNHIRIDLDNDVQQALIQGPHSFLDAHSTLGSCRQSFGQSDQHPSTGVSSCLVAGTLSLKK